MFPEGNVDASQITFTQISSEENFDLQRCNSDLDMTIKHFIINIDVTL